MKKSQLDIGHPLPNMHILILQGEAWGQAFGALCFLHFHYPPQSTREGFLLFFSKAHKWHINLGLPTALQKFLLVPPSTLPVVAAVETVHPEWCQ